MGERAGVVAFVAMATAGCSTWTGAQAGPALDLARRRGLDGVAVDAHTMTTGEWHDRGSAWADVGAHVVATERLQALGVEGGLGLTAEPFGVTFARVDPRLSLELFDRTLFFVPGAHAELGAAFPLSDRATIEPALCTSEHHRWRTLLTVAPFVDAGAHFTRPSVVSAGIAVGIARLDAAVGVVEGTAYPCWGD